MVLQRLKRVSQRSPVAVVYDQRSTAMFRDSRAELPDDLRQLAVRLSRELELDLVRPEGDGARDVPLPGLVPARVVADRGFALTFTQPVDPAELTELQVGSYAVMDAEYLNIGVKGDSARFVDFQPALTLLTTVVSVNHPELVTVDAGLKSLYQQGGVPFVISPRFSDLRYEWFGDEYGRITRSDHSPLPRLGTVLELVTSHCDPTVNLFDHYYLTSGERVTGTWPIDLRGCSQ